MGSRIAVIGAGGFVGARMLEMSAHDGGTEVVPIVRAFHSVARSAHLGVPHRLGDASRVESLERALVGCDAVVNLTMGAPAEILRTTCNIYAAAVAVGARVLVHMSSATVYGQVDRPDLPDDAPPIPDHWMPYAREKGRAETFLRGRMADEHIAVVVLRPGLVWGPSSPWVLGPATELVSGTAYLVGDGNGVCNLMYVDDLVRNVRAAVAHPVPGLYNVGDGATTTWRDYYSALADGLGVDMASVHRVAADRYRAGLRERLDGVRSTAAYAWLKDRLPLETRTAFKLQMARASARRAASRPAAKPGPAVTRTMWGLQTTRHALPTQKFRSAFGPLRRTPFESGMAASLAWLRFIGLDERELAVALGLPA